MKILMIGLGGIGQRHLRNIRSLLGNAADVIAYRVRRQTHVVTPTMNADPSRNVEQEYSIRVFSSLDEALEQKPEIAFICNPSSLHIPVTLACLKAGCDVFIEKPLSDSLQGTKELERVASEANRVAMVGYQTRFHPCLHKLAELVQSGILGNLLAVRSTIGEYLPNWHPFEDYRQIYAVRADLGGGVVLTQIHEFDFLYSLFGLPSRVYAIGGHWSELEMDVEDTASILMECAVAGRPLPIHLHQDYLQSPPNRQCEVIGDRGRVVMDLRAVTVTVFTRDVDIPVIHDFPGFERNRLFVDELSHFFDCVKTRRKPVVDLADGLQSLRMALAAKKSMSTHMPVELTEMK
jgi:predicted dehydrogenase